MKNVASAYIERWNFVLGAIFVAIVVFMPEGLVPGVARLGRWVAGLWRGDRRSGAPAWLDRCRRGANNRFTQWRFEPTTRWPTGPASFRSVARTFAPGESR